MNSRRPAWSVMLPGQQPLADYSFEVLRAAKAAHEFLAGPIPGPEPIARHIRSFRHLLFFAHGMMASGNYPALERAWKELGDFFLGNPDFDDDMFVHAWLLLDFPCGPHGETALDMFEAEVKQGPAHTFHESFIDAARGSRLGLYETQRVSPTKAGFLELFTGRPYTLDTTYFEFAPDEVYLVRLLEADGEPYIFGHAKSFPNDTVHQLSSMVHQRLNEMDEPALSVPERYESFMKLAGPYWMSCILPDSELPILDVLHYKTYLNPQAD